MIKTLPSFVLSCMLLCAFSTSLLAQGFSDQSSSAGIILDHDGDTALDIMSIGTGAAWIDYDNDDDIDLYITMRYTGNKLYENDGSGNFTEVAGALGAANATNDGSGVAAADFNNDGWVDLYLANGDEDRLFLNDNGINFVDVTASAGFDMTDDSRGTSASWGDYDGDGFLDLYVSHHNQIVGSLNASTQDKLYYNNGDTTFTDVSHLLPTADLMGFGFIGGWTDYDNDGDLDIFLVNDCLGPAFIGTKLFENGGTGASGDPKVDWVFTEVNNSEGINNDCRNGMGIAVGDYDRNSYMDVYYSNVGNAVLFCNGHASEGAFRDSTATAGVAGEPFPYFSWGTFFFDYDLDGWQDLFLAMGSHHYPSHQEVNPHYNILFKNNGDNTFSDVSVAMSMADSTRGRTCIYGDYDNDGDPDVLLANFGETVELKRNDNNNGNHYLWVDLEGTVSNRDGIGTKLKLTAGDGSVQYFETRSGSTLGGGDQIDAHFGLGSNTSIQQLELTWPSGLVETIMNPPIDTKLKLVENTPLDVTLSVFTAKLNTRDEVDLNWTTLSETNNQSFVIQKSTDGRHFNNIGVVAGQGTSSVVHNYDFVDYEPLPGSNYYRLKQIDFDGSLTYSPIRLVNYRPDDKQLVVYPNPFSNDRVQVVYTSTSARFEVKVVDALGATVLQKEMTNAQRQEAGFGLDLQGLNTGVYLLIIEDSNRIEYTKLIKK